MWSRNATFLLPGTHVAGPLYFSGFKALCHLQGQFHRLACSGMECKLSPPFPSLSGIPSFAPRVHSTGDVKRPHEVPKVQILDERKQKANPLNNSAIKPDPNYRHYRQPTAVDRHVKFSFKINV